MQKSPHKIVLQPGIQGNHLENDLATDLATSLILSCVDPEKAQKTLVCYIESQRWDVIEEFNKLLKAPPPEGLADTSPLKFKNWMKAITNCYLMGWNKINPPKKETH
jgi:hypothetical protein